MQSRVIKKTVPAILLVLLMLVCTGEQCPPGPVDTCDQYSGVYLMYTKTTGLLTGTILVDPECVDCKDDLKAYGLIDLDNWNKIVLEYPKDSGEHVDPYYEVCQAAGDFARVCTRDCDEDPHEVFFIDLNLTEILLNLSNHVDVSSWHYRTRGPFTDSSQADAE